MARKTERLTSVDVLRGIAILGVLVVHARYTFPDLPGGLRFVGGLGRYGVDLFFVVSAFTLFRPQQRPMLKNYFLRRWLRIAPVYYLGIVIYAVIPALVSSQPWPGTAAILANLAFVNGWIPGASGEVVPGGWSICAEAAFYCVLPVAAVFLTTLRRAVVAFVITLLVSSALVQLICGWLATKLPAAAIDDFRSYSPLAHLATFCLGIVLRHVLPALRARVPASKHAITAGALVVAGALLLPLLNAWDALRFLPRSILAGFPAFLFCAGVVLGLKTSSPKILAPLRWLGVISFGVYLTHFRVMEFVQAQLVGVLPAGAPGTVLFVSTVVVTLALSALVAFFLHVGLERPASRLARKPRDERVAAPGAR